jgi:nicotinamidase-related amidase/type 1 glutamine amidotransferase
MVSLSPKLSTKMKRLSFLAFVLHLALSVSVARPQELGEPLELRVRSQQPVPAAAGGYEKVERVTHWDPSKTAIIVCDMWDEHWCKGATARVAELAPRMNAVIAEARRRGVFIIHAPSDTMKFYAGSPQRQRAQQAPQIAPPADMSRWHSLNRAKEPPLPIDDSDGGCDDVPRCASGAPWTRQIAAIEIAPEDAVSDSGTEIYNLLHQFKRDHVIIMGVHANMCVLGRSFAIRQMVTIGKKVVLVRDMTDTMYNSRRPPYVNHFAGTDLVTGHIEKFWCPTITSSDFVGGEPFRFREDKRPRVVFIVGEMESHTWETLPVFAQQELAWRGLEFDFVNAPVKSGHNFTNWPAIAQADLLLVSSRRRAPPREMLELIRSHLDAGKPLAALRTASHAFAVKPPNAGHAVWDSFDRDVLGARYEGHFGNAFKPSITMAESGRGHEVLTGVAANGFCSQYSLYRSRDLGPATTVLLNGTILVDGLETTEPVAWINTAQDRRVFYTSLGGPDDFKEPAFRRLLLNGILWSLNLPVPPED